MTLGEIAECLDSTYDPGICDSVYKGLAILHKYFDPAEFDCVFAHDQMWCGIQYAPDTNKMSTEDIKEMCHLGWMIDDGYWSHF